MAYLLLWGQSREFKTMDNLHKKPRKRHREAALTVSEIYTLNLGKRSSVENKKRKTRKPLTTKGLCFSARIYNERKFLDRRADLWYDIDINNAY